MLPLDTCVYTYQIINMALNMYVNGILPSNVNFSQEFMIMKTAS